MMICWDDPVESYLDSSDENDELYIFKVNIRNWRSLRE